MLGYECFVGVIISDNELFIREAGEHCQRDIEPVNLGMKLTLQGAFSSLFVSQSTLIPARFLTSYLLRSASAGQTGRDRRGHAARARLPGQDRRERRAPAGLAAADSRQPAADDADVERPRHR